MAHVHAPSEDRERIPRILLRAMLALVLASLGLVTLARVTGTPPAAMPPDLPVVKERTLHIYGSMSGEAQVLDAHGSMIADLAPSKGGFIAGVWRAMARERQKQKVPLDAPVRLVQFTDGRLGLRDDLTGWRVELIGFGADNTAAFARLLSD